MDLHPTEDQDVIRQAAADWLAANMPLEGARARPEGVWAGMAEMGWLGVSAAEDRGGTALDYATEALVFAELGRFLAPVGAIAAAIAARWMSPDIARAVIAGETRTALALSENGKIRVLDAAGAALAVLADEAGARLLALPAEARPHVGLDLSTPQLVIDAPAPTGGSCSGAGPALHLRLLSAAYALGAAEAARDMAAAYALMREQFGRPIGAFQGIKHPCADMAVRCFSSRAQLLYAACAMDACEDSAPFHVAAVKRLADNAALENGRFNIQVHGGIGMTDEAAPHLVLKRAHLLQFIAPASIPALLSASAG